MFKKIRDIIAEQLYIQEDDIHLNSHLEEDLMADSLDIVELSMSLEDYYCIEFINEEWEYWKYVSDIVESIKKYIKEE